jgi:CRISPR-associated endonuclease/helicase Cas3
LGHTLEAVAIAPIPDTVLRYWAKLAPPRYGAGHEAADIAFHPLLCHAIDVGAVAETLWYDGMAPRARARLSGGLGLTEEQAAHWVPALAALHDLGKLCPSFQLRQEAAALAPLYHDLPRPRRLDVIPHGLVSARTLATLFVQDCGLERSTAKRLADAIGGHHGIFPSNAALTDLDVSLVGSGAWDEARRAVLRAIWCAFEVSGPGPSRATLPACMLLAGLTSVADWIGSMAERFPPAMTRDTLPDEWAPEAYAAASRARARDGLASIGWLGWAAHQAPAAFPALFPRLPSPRPLQHAVAELVATEPGPGLVIIEAPMGEGKTEAAFYAAYALEASAGHRGWYVALPTQATSNQMFARTRAFLEQVAGAGPVTLQLVHGHASLESEFRQLLREGAIRLTGVYDEAAPDAAVLAGSWFTYRKRPLLAPYGVGTIDQLLLAALQTRHGFVRLFAMGQKVLILDEVHAYDTYMTSLLERLMAWAGALGVSVVLLSATLPRSRRHALITAYRQGAGQPDVPVPQATYPRLTCASTGVRVASITASAMARDLALAPYPNDPAGVAQRLAQELGEGGNAAVVCNTVARAQAMYQVLRDALPGWDVRLLHARFRFCDRAAREPALFASYGPPGEHVARPQRSVLVATQVVEQSLDLDFDVMVSDLAPVDLLLQRSGRLHRHRDRTRPARHQAPRLGLMLPALSPEGAPAFLRSDTAVYDEHVLLRTWLAVHDRPAIAVPHALDALISAVYDDPMPDSLSTALQAAWHRTAAGLAEARAHEIAEAERRWIREPDADEPLYRIMREPHDEDDPGLHPAHQALTRLAEPSVTLVLLHDGPDGPLLEPGGAAAAWDLGPIGIEATIALLQRSVSISDRRVVHQLARTPIPPGWQQSPQLRYARPLVLDAARAARVGRWIVRCDVELGVVITDAEEEG